MMRLNKSGKVKVCFDAWIFWMTKERKDHRLDASVVAFLMNPFGFLLSYEDHHHHQSVAFDEIDLVLIEGCGFGWARSKD